MSVVQSQIHPLLTLEYITQADENKVFDRKAARVRVSDLGPIFSAFANAEGGTVVIGINEKTREVEGINMLGQDAINNLIAAPKDVCIPMPRYQVERLPVNNVLGLHDQLLLIHIEASTEQIIRTLNGSTYLRVADRTKELKGDDLRNLEYVKNIRRYEDMCHPDASIDDLDFELLDRFRKILHAENSSFEDILKARGFMRKQNNIYKLTNAAVLLFAKNIVQFYPNLYVSCLS